MRDHLCRFKEHRCTICDRWQRGFAPVKERVHPQAECQICERQIAVVDGLMVHHGYQRPGYGFIVGDCFGVKHAPYKATDALVKWLDAIKGMEERTKEYVRQLKAGEVLKLTYKYDEYVNGKYTPVSFEVKLGDEEYRHKQGFVPSFEEMLERRIRSETVQLQHLANEIKRIAKRIADAV